MKSRVITLATLALIAAAVPVIADDAAPQVTKETAQQTAAPSVKEEDFAKTLLGSWRLDMSQGQAKGHSITTYLADGKATSTGHFEAGDKEMNVVAKATWTLEKDQLVVVVTESSMPEVMPPGTKITQTIVSLNDKEFSYIQEGKQMTEKRVKEEAPKAEPKAQPKAESKGSSKPKPAK